MLIEIVNELTDEDIEVIKDAMKRAELEYSDAGYCEYRANYIRQLLNFGQVMTFSKSGKSAEQNYNAHSSEFIKIPYTPECYRDETEWLYHTVFVYKNYVFTYEIANWYCSLKDYRSQLNTLNGFIVKAYNEKVISK